MKIVVLYAVPPTSRKAAMWWDGFTAALDLLAERHLVRWVNVLAVTPTTLGRSLDEADAVMVKSSFGGIADAASRPWLARRPDLLTALAISGSGAPRPGDLGRFDVLFHETQWYRSFVSRHPTVVHAFGVDTRVMRVRPGIYRDIDWLMVGQPASYKRPESLIAKPGRRVLAGDLAGVPAEVLESLATGGVELMDFVPYTELAELYSRARTVLVTCELHGGGERSVLEARACGAEVRIADDNPKLAELMCGQVFDHEYYASQIEEGLLRAKDRPLGRTRKFIAHQTRNAAESSFRRAAGHLTRRAKIESP